MRQMFLDRGSMQLKLVSLPSMHDYSVVIANHYSLIGSSNEIELIFKNKPAILNYVPRKVKKILSRGTPRS